MANDTDETSPGRTPMHLSKIFCERTALGFGVLESLWARFRQAPPFQAKAIGWHLWMGTATFDIGMEVSHRTGQVTH